MSYSLFLYPANTDVSVDSKSLALHLSEIGFTRNDHEDPGTQPGPDLMELITFLGCSPVLSIGEIESKIHVHHFDRATAMGGDSIETLRYPECKHIIADPHALLRTKSPDQGWQCPECANQGQLDEINWRKSAAFARAFIEITHIFPKEAVPGDKLLEALQGFSHTKWLWFYSKSTL